MQVTTKVAANPAVIGQQIPDGEMILVNTETSASIVLRNATAVAIWQLVDGERTILEIAAAVEQQFEDVPPTMLADVRDVLDALVQGDFVLPERVCREKESPPPS